MATLKIMRGLPGSGKTTLAKSAQEGNADLIRVNRDDIRTMLFGTKKNFAHANEELVTKVSQNAVREALKAGRDVIVDDTNLRPKYVRAWRKIAKACGAEFTIHEMDTDVNVCIHRDSLRGGEDGVGRDVIVSMYKKFMRNGEYLPVPNRVEPEKGDLYVPDTSKPNAIIVDIDGTVADANGRDIYSTEGVGNDLLIEPIASLILSTVKYPTVTIFMSGRDESCREETQKWLEKHQLFDKDWDDILLMRPAGDNRRDSIVKQELFDKHVRHNYNVQYVFDDRDQVVKMWRDMGLTCLQVADGDF